MTVLSREHLAGRAARAALPAILLLASCTIAEREVAQQGGRIDDLQVRLLRLERALDEARAAPGPGAPADPELNRRVADLGLRLEELAEQVRALTGRVDTAERAPKPAPGEPRVSALEASLAGLARKVEALEKRPTATPAPAPTPAAPPPAAPPAPTPGPAATGQALYDKAYATYKQGRHDEAREAFREYVRQNPDTSLTDNAHFWLGESYYDQAQYEQAILEYDKVVQKFPKGDKVASALLKQAFAFDAIGDPVDARILLKKIVREHPASEQAAIAKKKLEILGE